TRMLVETEELKAKPRTTLRELVAQFDDWAERSRHLPHAELAEQILDESGYTAMWQADKSADAPGRLENLKELVSSMGEFETLGSFLEHIALVMDRDTNEAQDAVSIMTLHGAKGLEFSTVFLPGWEEGLFPSQRSMDEHGLAGLEEERRLAYVGLTRARHRAQVSFAANRRIHGQWQSSARSRFVDELPTAHIEMETEPGLGGVGNWASASPWGASWNAANTGGGDRMVHTPPRPPVLIESARVPGRGQEVPKIGGFSVGDRVFHQKFGYGVIREVEDNRLAIDFEHAGDKKVMDAFVERA
ncbi:MAG TPA: 3'-5' exonuclease, partial [Stellaceae bacterium]|nr:3'-5' exonuclease [Stellaceae bacterium]